MNLNFYIVEDDEVIQNILKNIIMNNNLGDVVGIAGDGETAVRELQYMNPDIVLIDLLLPKKDGISILSEVKAKNEQIQFIMISEVRSSDMIAKAYQEGIEFFINKPINVIEVISVIKKVNEKLEMAQVISSFETAFSSMRRFRGVEAHSPATSGLNQSIDKLFLQLGISGDKGAVDLVEIVRFLEEENRANGVSFSSFKMSELYKHLSDKYEQTSGKAPNVSAIEQRIRRAVFRALENVSNMGIEDYGNEVFTRYSNTLFEFKEVRIQMDFIRGKSYDKGSISVRKFIDGIMASSKQHM